MTGSAAALESRQLIDGRWQGARDGGVWRLVDPGRGEAIDEVPFGRGDAAAKPLP